MRIERRGSICSLLAAGIAALALSGCGSAEPSPSQSPAPSAAPSAAPAEVDAEGAIAGAADEALAAASAAIAECAAGAYGDCDVWAWTIAHHTIERWDVGAPVLVDPGQLVEYDGVTGAGPIATVCQTYEATGTGSAVAVGAAPASEGEVRIGTGVIIAVAADGAFGVDATYRCGP